MTRGSSSYFDDLDVVHPRLRPRVEFNKHLAEQIQASIFVEVVGEKRTKAELVHPRHFLLFAPIHTHHYPRQSPKSSRYSLESIYNNPLGLLDCSLWNTLIRCHSNLEHTGECKRCERDDAVSEVLCGPFIFGWTSTSGASLNISNSSS